jgi:hypothetical protein
MFKKIAAAGLGALALTTLPAQAFEVYGQAGVPGAMLGVAYPLNSHFAVRADVNLLSDRTKATTEEGINYNGTLSTKRTAAFIDWFPFEGGFRLTLGGSANKYQMDLTASGAGGTLTIGDTQYVTTSADRFDVQIKFPKSTPYFGVGWGHQLDEGLRFSFDLGAMFGKATVSGRVSGPAAAYVTQADIDKELQELRDGAAKVKAIPQISFAIGYSF